ncbi:MAG: response regulator transcription factor [Actinobacteria bacterium]|nr:response regulator transcription factor [Actinomycetota bacterium]MBO0787830.1 response regulator transcription factor [Actinomycetota bacterium]
MPTPLGDAGAGPVRVLVVEDHPLVLQAFSLAFDEVPDVELVAQARLLEEAIVAAREHRPDVVLLDRLLPDGDGIEAIGRLRQESGGSRVLVLTGYADTSIVSRVIEAGASGLLLKGAGRVDDLVNTIRRVAAGEPAFPADLVPGAPGGAAAQ